MIAALNKHWRPLTEREFEDMTLEEISEASTVATLGAFEVPNKNGGKINLIDWIWEKKRDPFEVY